MRSNCCQYSAYKECPFKKCQNHGSGKNLFFKLICNIFWILRSVLYWYILVMICFAIYNQSLIFFLIQVNQGPTTRCKDKKKRCRSRRKQGYCTKKNHVRYMKTNCKKSCSFCDAVWNWLKSTSKPFIVYFWFWLIHQRYMNDVRA